MRTKRIVGAAVAALICIVAASYWIRDHPAAGSRNRSETAASQPPEAGTTAAGRENAPPPESAADSSDVIVVETEKDVRQEMRQWAEQGSNVLWISGPMRREDGTLYRTAKLTRARR